RVLRYKLDAVARDAARPVRLLDGHAYAVVSRDAVLRRVARERHEGPDANLLVRWLHYNVAGLTSATADDTKAYDEHERQLTKYTRIHPTKRARTARGSPHACANCRVRFG